MEYGIQNLYPVGSDKMERLRQRSRSLCTYIHPNRSMKESESDDFSMGIITNSALK